MAAWRSEMKCCRTSLSGITHPINASPGSAGSWLKILYFSRLTLGGLGVRLE